MQKLRQFWFPEEYTCFRGSGFRMVPAVVPRYPAVVPLRGHKRQYRSAAVVPAVTPQQYYRWLTRSLPRRFEGSFSVSDCAVPRCGSSAAVPPSSAVVPLGSLFPFTLRSVRQYRRRER